MGSKGSNTTTQNQTQTYTANPAIQGAGYQALNMAQSAANQPFQMPVAPVAGFSPLQQQAFNQYQSLQGTAQPYYNSAQSLYQQSAAPITGADVNQYYNPMASNVTAQLQNIFGQQNQQNTANLVQSAGGVGADRIAVGQGNMANQQGLAAGQTYANLYQQALQAAQGQKQMAAGAASGLTGLGGAAQNSALQGTAALYGAGTAQQQQSQAELNAPYQNQLARLAYPFQTAQYLAGITGGLSGALGGTTTGQSQTTTPSPSIWSQLLGAGTAGLGLYQGLGGGSGSAAYGGGNAFTDAYGGSGSNPLPGLSPSDYGPGYADGGEVDVKPIDDTKTPIVPTMQVQSGSGQAHNNLNFSQPQSQSGGSGGIGDAVKMAAQFLPLMLKQGGVAGYDDGGHIPSMWDPADNVPGTPTYTKARPISGVPTPWPTTPDQGDQPPPRVLRPGSLLDRWINGSDSGGQTAPATGQPSADNSQSSVLPYQRASQDVPATPFPTAVQPSKVATGAPPRGGGASNTAAPPASNESTGLPYPDATKRDWGQDLARSPWMSLVQAGATMMATPGPVGQAIGKGLLAGAKSLEDQRKQGQSETEINQKAQALMETAKQHLDKYNKMTPYERASIAIRNRELDQEESSVSGKPGKFTGADYDRAAKFIQGMNPGLPPEQLQPLIDAEVARRRRVLAAGTAGAAASNVASGDTAANALPDPGEAGRTKGKWYIGPTGQPQQWLGNG